MAGPVWRYYNAYRFSQGQGLGVMCNGEPMSKGQILARLQCLEDVREALDLLSEHTPDLLHVLVGLRVLIETDATASLA